MHIFPTCKSHILHKAKAFIISRKVNFHPPYIRTYFSSTFHSLHMLSSAENRVYCIKIKDKCTLHRSFIIVRMFSHLATSLLIRHLGLETFLLPVSFSALFIDLAGCMLFPVNPTMQRFTTEKQKENKRNVEGLVARPHLVIRTPSRPLPPLPFSPHAHPPPP